MSPLSSIWQYFPGRPGLAGTRMSPSWILLELRMTEVVVTTGAIRCSSHNVTTDKPTSSFLQAGCPSCRPLLTVSEHWRESFDKICSAIIVWKIRGKIVRAACRTTLMWAVLTGELGTAELGLVFLLVLVWLSASGCRRQCDWLERVVSEMTCNVLMGIINVKLYLLTSVCSRDLWLTSHPPPGWPDGWLPEFPLSRCAIFSTINTLLVSDYLSVIWHCWLGLQEGHPACKKLAVGLLMVSLWIELCTSYSSSCYHHLHHS